MSTRQSVKEPPTHIHMHPLTHTRTAVWLYPFQRCCEGLNRVPESSNTIVLFLSNEYATGAACQQRTLTPPDTWSCPTLGLACVLMSRPISPELVLSPDFWISNTPRYFSFAHFSNILHLFIFFIIPVGFLLTLIKVLTLVFLDIIDFPVENSSTNYLKEIW